MLERTMKQILIKKSNEWLETVTDDVVKKAIKKDLIITGGCFASMIQSESPKDFDCYFATKDTAILVSEYYIKLWKETHPDHTVFVVDGSVDEVVSKTYFVSKDRVKIVIKSGSTLGDGKEVGADQELGSNVESIVSELDEISAEEVIKEEKKKFFPVFISSNAITLSNGIQLVVRFYGDPSSIHDTYDFVHTKAYWKYSDQEVVIPKEVYECVINKTLLYTGSKYPVCSVFRVRKFIDRGWKINAGQLLKMCMQISELNLQDVATLEDQLIGVDSLYFMRLIEIFKDKKNKEPGFELTAPYIISIVDRMFG